MMMIILAVVYHYGVRKININNERIYSFWLLLILLTLTVCPPAEGDVKELNVKF